MEAQTAQAEAIDKVNILHVLGMPETLTGVAEGEDVSVEEVKTATVVNNRSAIKHLPPFHRLLDNERQISRVGPRGLRTGDWKSGILA